jgi:hypothetical protein
LQKLQALNRSTQLTSAPVSRFFAAGADRISGTRILGSMCRLGCGKPNPIRPTRAHFAVHISDISPDKCVGIDALKGDEIFMINLGFVRRITLSTI